MDSGRKITRNVLAQIARVGLSTVTGMVIARGLHADGRGTFSVVTTIATTALALGHLSVEQAHMALWRRARRAIPVNSVLLGPVTGAVAGVAAGIVVPLLGPRAVPLASYALLLAALVSVPFAMTVLYANSVLVLQGRVEMVNRAVLAAGVVQLAVLAALGLDGRLSVAAVVWIWTLYNALPLAILVPALTLRLREADRRVARQMLTYGLRYHIGFAALFLLLRLDVLLLNALSSETVVGLYSVAVMVGELAWIVTNATAQVALAQQAEAELSESANVTLSATRLSVLLSAVAVVGMCVTAPVLMPLLYGSAFSGSVPVLLALAPGIFAFGATRQINAHLVRLDRPLVSSGVALVATVGNVVLCLLMIPRWGAVGCALASSAGYFALAGAQVVWFLRATRTPARRLLPGRAELGVVNRLRGRFGTGATADPQDRSGAAHGSGG
jgi:O-antigen/teichoic acid export membrane protein